MDRDAVRSLLIGDSRRASGRFLGAAAALSVGFFALTHALRAVGAGDVTWLYGLELAAALVLGASAAHAYANRGVVTCVAVAYLLVAGAFVSGFVPIGTTGRGNVVAGLLRFSALVAAVVGVVGFVLGAGAAWLRDRTRAHRGAG